MVVTFETRETTLLRRYHKSIIVLLVIALQFYIRNPPTAFYKNGMAFAWILWAFTIYGQATQLVKLVGTTFLALMVYCLADNLFFDLKEFDLFDLYAISGIAAAGVVAAVAFTARSQRPTRKELVSCALLVLIAAVIIAGRNYLYCSQWAIELLGWKYDLVGGPFFEADAFAGVLSSAYFIYTTTGINLRVGIVHLLFTLHNYYKEIKLDPVHTSLGEWIIIGIIIAFGAWLILRYLVRSYRK